MHNKNHRFIYTFFFIISLFLLSSCIQSTKKKSDPQIQNFVFILPFASYTFDSPLYQYALTDVDVSRYVGKWTEWKRIDNSFQRNLKNVTAEYAILDSLTISVKNSGLQEDGQVSVTEGVGTIKYPNRKGYLKVSFSPFFYGDYYVLRIDSDYKHALVGGPSSNFLWILTKDTNTIASVESNYIEYARSLGYDINSLKRF